MALPPEFLDELRARTPLPAVIGRRVKLTRSGRQWKGCCPFHGEKTPSFYVYEDHYHCFGCGAHGDAVSFVMQSQGSGFVEAVEQLASEAGLDVPKPTPQAAEAERRRHDLHTVLEAAGAVFRRKLFEPEGARALAYLRGRGLSDETITRFGLGWSGEGRGALAAILAQDEIRPDMLLQAGLLTDPGEGRSQREFFFNRVMFPIRDRRGRIISFGGRILGDGQPKYLNGPETPVFSKRRTLFGLDAAREAARGGAAVVAVEGYMDVIALHQAGFAGAVAPLGTALTEEQLEELWRLSPAPVLCFDGDAAGGRAAARAAELALPFLTPERTLRFAALPAGEDPDTLVRRSGNAAFQAVLESARSLSEALFDLVRESAGEATPEQRAALRGRLEEAAGRIRDKALSAEYRRALLDRYFARRAATTASRRNGGGKAVVRPMALVRPVPAESATAAERAAILIAVLLHHPALLHDVEEALGALDLPPPLAGLRGAILQWSTSAEVLDSTALIPHLAQAGFAADVARVVAAGVYPLPAFALPGAQPAEAEAGWWHIFGLMHRGRLEEEVVAASRAFASRPDDDAAQRRLIALCTAREALRRGEQGGDAGPD